MSKQPNKTLIGVFVIGAVALAVAGLLVFGGGKFFAPMKKFVMFFEGSVKGLNIGAPVIFRGVKIGEVTNIKLVMDPKDLTAVIPVYVEIDPRTISAPEGEQDLMEKASAAKEYLYIKPLIEKGLRAQLQMQSFVTGQLMVNLDFHPDKPVKLVGLEKKYPEIPTVSTPMEELSKTIADLPLKDIVVKLDATVDGLQRMLNAPGAKDTFTTVNKTMAQAERTLQTFAAVARDNQKLGYDLNVTLKELNATSRSLRYLTDYLERHPEALIRGKQR